MASKAQDTLQPIAQHGQLKSPSAWSQIGKFVGLGALVVTLALGGVAAWASTYLWGGFADKAQALDGDPPGFGAIEGGANILIVGTDACEPGYEYKYGDRCANAEDGPIGANSTERNDVNLLVHISDEPRKVTVISFSRDIVMDLPSCTDADGEVHDPIYERINESYSRGGLNCVARTIEKLSNYKVHIQYAAKTSWQGVVNITNAIGGVEVCVENGISDYHTGLHLAPGTYELAGDNALAFLRTRHGVGNGGDETRMSNQQVYMSALARKILSDGVLGDVPTLLSLSKTVLDNVVPSTSLTDPTELVSIAQALRGVPLEDIKFISYPLLPNPENPDVNYVPNKEVARQMWDAVLSGKSFEVTGKTSGVEKPKEKDPVTGNEIDPRTGLQIDPDTSWLIDPDTGELLDPDWVPSLEEVDEGESDDPSTQTAAPVDPNAPIQLPEEITGTTPAETICSGGRGLDEVHY